MEECISSCLDSAMKESDLQFSRWLGVYKTILQRSGMTEEEAEKASNDFLNASRKKLTTPEAESNADNKAEDKAEVKSDTQDTTTEVQKKPKSKHCIVS